MSCHFFVSTTRDGRTSRTINARDQNGGKCHQITCTGSVLGAGLLMLAGGERSSFGNPRYLRAHASMLSSPDGFTAIYWGANSGVQRPVNLQRFGKPIDRTSTRRLHAKTILREVEGD